MQFKRGEFQEFRATTKVHLGKMERDIFENDVIEFDGTTVKFGGEEFGLSTIRAAIEAGWFVVSDDNVSKYIPQPSNIKVRPAQAADMTDRGEPMEMGKASDEERVVGTLDTANLGGRTTEKGTTEGIAVGTIKTSAKQKTIVSDSSQTAREISRLDNSPPPKAEVRVATGDVDEAITGETLSDILPDAVSSGTPAPTKTKKRTGVPKFNPERVVTVAVSDGKEITWDMNAHWRTRAKKAVAEYGGNKEALDAIIKVESKGVAKEIKAAIGS
jgi:hypothetical protein